MPVTDTGTGLCRFLCPGQEKKGGVRGDRLHSGYKGVQAVRPESVAGGAWFEVLWNLEKKYVCISMKEIWHNLGGPPKNKELWSYIVKFELVGRK